MERAERRAFLLGGMLGFCVGLSAVLFSCGGGGANTQEIGLSLSSPLLLQDIRCCAQIDNQTGDCSSYAVPPSANATITVQNDSDQWFGKEQAVQVEGCSVEAIPIGDTPPVPPEVQIGSCSQAYISANSTGTVQLTLSPAFVSYLKSEWESSGIDIFQYKLKVNLAIKGQESGTYDKTVYLLLNASDYSTVGNFLNPLPEENLCEVQQ